MSKVTLEKLRKRIVVLEQEAKETTELLAFLIEIMQEKGLVRINGDTLEIVEDEKPEIEEKEVCLNSEECKKDILETIKSADKRTLVRLAEICQKGAINFDFKLDVYDFYKVVFKKDLKSFEDLFMLDKEKLRKFVHDLVEKLPKFNLAIDFVNKLREGK